MSVTKDITVSLDEAERTPILSRALREAVAGLWYAAAGAGGFLPSPLVIELGETREGSPLDSAFSGSRNEEPAEGGEGAELREMVSALGLDEHALAMRLTVHEREPATVVLACEGGGAIRSCRSLRSGAIVVRRPGRGERESEIPDNDGVYEEMIRRSHGPAWEPSRPACPAPEGFPASPGTKATHR